jgi:hypothetical protein
VIEVVSVALAESVPARLYWVEEVSVSVTEAESFAVRE